MILRRRGGTPAALPALAVLAALALGACSAPGRAGTQPDSVDVVVPTGASGREVASRLAGAGLVRHPRLFALYARLLGSAGHLKSGHYRFAARSSWPRLLATLRAGEVVTRAVTIPEGFELREIAPRLAEVTASSSESILALARDTLLADSLGVPGPTLEGYLFPDTYRFAEGIPAREALGAMVARYRSFWGPAERRQMDSLDMDERQVVTLASIVEKEAKKDEERPIIAGVYLNRLRKGMLLQADPTVQFALDSPRARLLYADIDRVADNPYNTYTHRGLPPGPIASPGAASLEAVLHPAHVPYLYFVARPDGSHVFTRTEREHVNAKNRIRGQRR